MVDTASLVERRRQILLNTPHLETISDSIASFKTDVPALVKDCKVYFSPVQEGSGDPSPENIRPITGWTEATLYKTGKNLLGGAGLKDAIISSMPSATDYPDDKYVTFASTATTTHSISYKRIKFKTNTSYTFIITYRKGSGSGSNLRVYYTDGTYANMPTNSSGTKMTVHYVTNSSKTVSNFSKFNSSSTTYLYYDESGIFEGSLQISDFEQYKGESTQCDWQTEAGTVYGGYVDLAKGEVVEEWSQIASYNGETLPGEWISDRDVYTAGTSPTIGAQVAYKLATPITHQLTPETIKTLRGINNIWSNANGNIEVKFWKH